MTRPSTGSSAPPGTAGRSFDVILFGATGFTGFLVAQYMAKRAVDNGVRWAIAGRSRDKLEVVRAKLAASDETLAELPILVADALDTASLDRLVPQTRVVATTVGPYAKYGLELARACARHGTSYCDLTGEPNFVRSVIDACHADAQRTDARIVPTAGFDSIPSDLGAYLAWEHAHRTHGEGLAWVKIFTGRTKGKVSGGTVASVLHVVDAAMESRTVRRQLRNPHGLDPEPRKAKRDPFEDDQRGVRFDRDLRRWTAPFLMASINARVVRRSHALLEAEGKGYGPSFRYHEAMSFGRGPRGLAQASVVTAGVSGLFAAAAFRPARGLLERMLPAPGEGPTREEIDQGFFEMLILAKTQSGRSIRGRIAGTKDPGYGETATMLSETAMCLAKDSARLEPRYGVLTPASAMGLRIVERLRSANISFDVYDI